MESASINPNGIIQKTAELYEKACLKLPRSILNSILVTPHPGHFNPVIKWNTHGIPPNFEATIK